MPAPYLVKFASCVCLPGFDLCLFGWIKEIGLALNLVVLSRTSGFLSVLRQPQLQYSPELTQPTQSQKGKSLQPRLLSIADQALAVSTSLNVSARPLNHIGTIA